MEFVLLFLLIILFMGCLVGAVVYAVLRWSRGRARGLEGSPASVPGSYSVPRGIRRGACMCHPGGIQRYMMNNIFVRSLIIAAITLGLLIPLLFVSDIVYERSSMRRHAINDIAGLWGRSQTISGPVLVIPYLREYEVSDRVTDDEGKQRVVVRKAQAREYRIILPQELDYEAVLFPQVRNRGIYDYVVYTSPITVAGKFRLPSSESFGENTARIDWDKSWMALGVSDLRAITEVGKLSWDGAPAPAFNPGTGVKNLIGPGFQAEVMAGAAAAPGTVHEFALELKLNGSGGLHFTPVGENTRIKISGDWAHPSFSGSLLPTTRSITDTSFSGEWSIPHLSRTYPQSGILGADDFRDDSTKITAFTAGVDLFETVSLYSQVDRAVKYAILFIGLTFIALLSFELVSKARLHFMQYGLVGIAMTMFYLVLLSLAEHTSFLLAFAAASAVSIVMNGLYIMAAMRSRKKGLVVMGMLSALYLLLYALLQMEEYALLMGTFLVLIVVGVLMFLTRHLTADKNAEGGTENRGRSRGESQEALVNEER